MKKIILDNLPTVWVIGIVLLSLVLVSNHANADMNTKITDTKNKIVNHLANEKAKTIEFQKKSWADAKKKWPWNKIFKDSNEQ